MSKVVGDFGGFDKDDSFRIWECDIEVATLSLFYCFTKYWYDAREIFRSYIKTTNLDCKQVFKKEGESERDVAFPKGCIFLYKDPKTGIETFKTTRGVSWSEVRRGEGLRIWKPLVCEKRRKNKKVARRV